MLRRVDESCVSFLDGGHLVLDVPGCRITHRMQLDEAWRGALATAQELARQFALPDSIIERQIHHHLDLLDDAMSGLERRIIIGIALGKAEA